MDDIYTFGRLRLKFKFCYPPTRTRVMEYLLARRIDVYSAEQLDRYEQLFDNTLSHTIFGMGEIRSIAFLQHFTVGDICTIRLTCFAFAVEVHDVMEAMQLQNLRLVTPARQEPWKFFCWLL